MNNKQINPDKISEAVTLDKKYKVIEYKGDYKRIINSFSTRDEAEKCASMENMGSDTYTYYVSNNQNIAESPKIKLKDVVSELLREVNEDSTPIWKRTFQEFKTEEDFVNRLRQDSFTDDECKFPVIINGDDIIIVRKDRALFYKVSHIKKHGGFYTLGQCIKQRNVIK